MPSLARKRLHLSHINLRSRSLGSRILDDVKPKCMNGIESCEQGGDVEEGTRGLGETAYGVGHPGRHPR